LDLQVHGLLNIVRQTNLSQNKDMPYWKWTKNGTFSVKSMYNHLCRNARDRSFRHLWKSKIPLKIKIQLWLIWHNAITTKYNPLKRNWSGCPRCQFCCDNETVTHLVFWMCSCKICQEFYGEGHWCSHTTMLLLTILLVVPSVCSCQPQGRNTQIDGLQQSVGKFGTCEIGFVFMARLSIPSLNS
jgi:hypothetical protein